MSRKFTQKEFVERHVEFLKNYGTKYKFQDLDFRAVMGMSGCDEDEFKEHMDEMWLQEDPTLTTLMKTLTKWIEIGVMERMMMTVEIIPVVWRVEKATTTTPMNTNLNASVTSI